MRRIIAALNMTLDGICDHTAGMPDEEIHQHYAELLSQGDAILYGRKTYELMEFWQTIIEKPTEEQFLNDFAKAIDKIPKIVFTHKLKATKWESATIAKNDLKKEVLEFRHQSGNDILVGSRSLIIQLIQLELIDELQLCIYPMLAGKGLALFENIRNRVIFKLLKTKTFNNGSIILYYHPKKIINE